jgi:hypothetical protein
VGTYPLKMIQGLEMLIPNVLMCCGKAMRENAEESQATGEIENLNEEGNTDRDCARRQWSGKTRRGQSTSQ